ncbi:MAG: sugar phosphate isomerase/epimerase [Nitrospirae bacterium]|nr:sugar phosphate isomerase/epimerase [Nitrospirota bacterium]MCL5423128.1 sugar phosphate isomerase/epimerase [Nitrospirota bacterium]
MLKIGVKIDEVRIDGDLKKLASDLTHYKKININATEIPVHGLDAIQYGRLDKGQVKRIKEILKDFDFQYSVHCPNPLNLMDRENPELHISVLRATLEFASEIGSNIIVYHPGRYIPEEAFPVNGKVNICDDEKISLLDFEASAIEKLSTEYLDIIVCMENARPYLFHSPYCYAEQPELLKEQVLKINRGNVKINLDFGHLYMASKFYNFDHVSAVSEIKDLIAHTHIHDNFGNAVYYHEKQQTHQIPFGKGDSHMPVGWGEIPIKELLSSFVASYEGMFMMELRSRYFEHIRESKENLEGLLWGLTKT